jgi:hypothetical protein
MDEKTSWLMEASQLHRRIKHARVSMGKIFPKPDYLQPLAAVDSTTKMKVIEFLSFDTSKLVPVSELERQLALAERMRIDSGEILFAELRDIYSRAIELKKMIIQYAASSHKTYAEAKFLFSEILQIGIWLEEASIIKKIIQVNKRIEKFLGGTREECLEGLKEIPETEGKYIDSGFKKDIASRFKEIDSIQRRIDVMLEHQSLDFEDYEVLEKLVKDSQVFPHFIPNLDMLVSLFKSYVWALHLGSHFGLKSPTLETLVRQTAVKVGSLKDKPEFGGLRDRLQECLSFVHTQHPLTILVQETKYLFWQNDAQELISRPSFSLSELEGLVERTPNHPSNSQTGIYVVLKVLHRKSQAWRKEAERVMRQTSELKTCKSEEFSRVAGASLGQIEEVTTRLLKEYFDGLSQVEELQQLRAELDTAEKVLSMCRCIHRLNINKKMELADYQKAKDLMKAVTLETKKLDPLFTSFKQIIRLFNAEVKLLKEFHSSTLLKELHATPDLFEPKFLAYARELQRLEGLQEAVVKVEDHINLGEMGLNIKAFLADFAKAENHLMSLVRSTRPGEVGELEEEQVKALLDEFEERKQKMHVRVYSPHLEELARYEWVLRSVLAIKSSQVPLEVLEKLRESSDVSKLEDREIVGMLKTKIKRGESLLEDIQSRLAQGESMTIQKLREIKSKLDNSPILLKSIKRQVDADCRAFDHVERDFEAARQGREGGNEYVPSVEELRMLLKEAQGLKYRSLEMETSIAKAIASSECLMKLSIEGENEEGLLALEMYQENGVKTSEAEYILYHRTKAMEYLNRPDLSIENMRIEELRLVEKCLTNALDGGFRGKFEDKILKRKVQILNQLEKKPTDVTSTGVVKPEEFQSLIHSMREKSSLFTADEIDQLGEKLEQAELYINQLKKSKEEVLKKCRRVLFNYLDLSEIIDKQLSSLRSKAEVVDLHRDTPETVTSSVHREKTSQPNLGQLPVTNTRVGEVKLDKEEKKNLRKDLIKNLRDKLLSVFENLSKEEATEQARGVEAYIYSQNKVNILEYMQRVADYEKLIEKSKSKPFLVELITARPLPARFVQKMVGDKAEEFFALRDEQEARRYIRNFGVAPTIPEVRNGSFPIPFSEEELALMSDKKEVRQAVHTQNPVLGRIDEQISVDQSSRGGDGMYEEHEIIDETPEESRSELQTPKPVTVETNPQDDKKPSRNHTEVITDNPTTGEEVTSQLDFELHITVKEKKVTVSANEKQSGQLVKRPPLIGRETTQKANDTSLPEEIPSEDEAESRNRTEPANPGGKWQVFEGGLKFILLRKMANNVKLVSMSSFKQLSYSWHSDGDQIEIEGSSLVKDFEKKAGKIRTRLLKKEVSTVSGFVWADEANSRILHDIRKSKLGCYFEGGVEGGLIYLLAAADVPSNARYLFDSLEELAKVDCAFLWVQVSDSDREMRNSCTIKPFIDKSNGQQTEEEGSLSVDWEESADTN